jgi:hypothetical protein
MYNDYGDLGVVVCTSRCGRDSIGSIPIGYPKFQQCCDAGTSQRPRMYRTAAAISVK